jgi:hypothetical protein
MNKIVRDHYPVSALPDDLRAGLDPKTRVRVIIEEEQVQSTGADQLSSLLAAARRLHPIGDDPVARIRKLRDEWDD